VAYKVCITGAAGQIAYSLFPHICSGATFGADKPVILHLLDIDSEMATEALKGVKMELEDAAYPLLQGTCTLCPCAYSLALGPACYDLFYPSVEVACYDRPHISIDATGRVRPGVVLTTKVDEAFTDIDFCIMLGAFPRKPGMERKDLLKMNAGIFKEQGAALNKLAKKSVKVLVVGNPANTNCLIAKSCAPDLPAESFSALTRLDHNRAKAQVALKVGVSVDKVKNTIIWGNHSGTQYPDVNHATVDGKAVRPAVNDDAWLAGEFITTVQQRGAAIINTRKLSSALSAAAAIRDHLRDWVLGTPEGEFVSMAVWSTGQGYGIADGLIYSYPVTCKNGAYTVVAGSPHRSPAHVHTPTPQPSEFLMLLSEGSAALRLPLAGWPIDDFSRAKMDASTEELLGELADAKEFMS
jgi:malate dehydrogenase